jgi:Domain of unknown function (DUF1707)
MSSQSDNPGGRPYYGFGPRGRGFGPMFRDLYAEVSDQHLRVSDAERQSVTDRLSEHFAAGRLDQAEFDERVGQAMNAKTRGDLSGLFADLPDTGAPAVPAHIRRRRHPVLLVALLVVALIATAHVLWWIAVPMLWLGLLFVVVLAVTGRIGHHHPHHDQDRQI